MVRERPILFSGAMVRAILAGEKTVTRRALKVQPVLESGFWVLGGAGWSDRVEKVVPVAGHSLAAKCPYGLPGDRLWVRESFRDARAVAAGRVLYRASGDFCCGWKPSIHMPRDCSRILLEVAAVSIERLQAGDGETAFESRYVAEGINRIHHGDGAFYFSAFRDEPSPENWGDPFDAWRELWSSINGIDSWNANPWVWVVEFKLVEVAHG